MVLQDTTLFTGTIRDNIGFGIPDATDEQIIHAARAARAHDFIQAFRDGYDTRVGERGVTLSGGQKQRIAIARALLLDPRILILDDFTSAVDTETEALIREALATLMHGRTTFVIAQRVSTVQHADHIIVLDQGVIAGMGTHDELLETNSIYAEVYRLQLMDETVLEVFGSAEDGPWGSGVGARGSQGLQPSIASPPSPGGHRQNGAPSPQPRASEPQPLAPSPRGNAVVGARGQGPGAGDDAPTPDPRPPTPTGVPR
jgi:hypothetical protein